MIANLGSPQFQGSGGNAMLLYKDFNELQVYQYLNINALISCVCFELKFR